MDNLERLEKLAALRQSGVLTAEEFEAQKQQLLGSGLSKGSPAPQQTPAPGELEAGDDDAIDAYSGMRAAFFMTILYVWYGFGIAVRPEMAGITSDLAPYAIGMVIPALALLLIMGHLSSRRHSIAASAGLMIWAGFDVVSNLINLIQERQATFFVVVSLLFAAAAAYQAFDAIRFAWAVQKAQSRGEPLPEAVDRTGAGRLLTSQAFWALLMTAFALMATLYLWFRP